MRHLHAKQQQQQVKIGFIICNESVTTKLITKMNALIDEPYVL